MPTRRPAGTVPNAPILLDVLTKRRVTPNMLAKTLRNTYGIQIDNTNVYRATQETIPGKEKYWDTILKCLDEQYGIVHDHGGWWLKADLEVRNKKYNKPSTNKSPTNPGLPAVIANDNRDLIKQLVAESVFAYKQPRVRSDEELAERWDTYFAMCAERGQIPTVEELALYAGYATDALCDIENGTLPGFSPETKRIVKHAKSVLKTFDAKFVTSGKLNFLTYCFRAKNYYGMVDRQDVNVAPQQKAENDFSAEDLRKRYALETTSEEGDVGE